MFFFKKLGKSFLISLITLLVLTLIVTIFNYIGLFNLSIVNIFSYITPFISLFIGGFIMGKNTVNKGWLEGIKFGLICIIIFTIFNYLAFDTFFNISNIILYVITLIASILGSIIGINFKKNNED